MCDQRSSESFRLLERDNSLCFLWAKTVSIFVKDSSRDIHVYTWPYLVLVSRTTDDYGDFFTSSHFPLSALVVWFFSVLHNYFERLTGHFDYRYDTSRRKREHKCFHHLFFDQRGLDQEESHQGAAYPVPSLFQ